MNSTSHHGFDIPVKLLLLDGEREELEARIRRVNTGFFQIHSYAPIRCERKLLVLYQGRSIEAQAVYCQHQDSGGYHIGLELEGGTSGTIRQELRLPVDVRGSMAVPGSTNAIRVRLVDMSQSGIGLVVAKAIPAGTFVALALEHGTAFGEIRSCEPHLKRTFRVGFWLEEFIPRNTASSMNAHVWGLSLPLRLVKRICAALHFRNTSRDASRKQSRAAC
ncbi:MAG TPA: PilZ domain-containing protein [Bryobacteraceae bacterium]|jgi:hypothetical protein